MQQYWTLALLSSFVVFLIGIHRIHEMSKKDHIAKRLTWVGVCGGGFASALFVLASTVPPSINPQVALLEITPKEISVSVAATNVRKCAISSTQAMTRKGGISTPLPSRYTSVTGITDPAREFGVVVIRNNGSEFGDISISMTYFCPLGIEVSREMVVNGHSS